MLEWPWIPSFCDRKYDPKVHSVVSLAESEGNESRDETEHPCAFRWDPDGSFVRAVEVLQRHSPIAEVRDARCAG